MTIEIKNRHTGDILFDTEEKNFKITLETAVKQDIDLRSADLSGATYGKNIPLTKTPLQILGLHWIIFIFNEHMKIGCELHSITAWQSFDDNQINKMDSHALKFWHKNRENILALAKAHQKTD